MDCVQKIAPVYGFVVYCFRLNLFVSWKIREATDAEASPAWLSGIKLRENGTQSIGIDTDLQSTI